MHKQNTWANEIDRNLPHLRIIPMARKLSPDERESRAIIAAILAATKSTENHYE